MARTTVARTFVIGVLALSAPALITAAPPLRADPNQQRPDLARYYAQVLQWGPCPGADTRLQCARLTVPRDYDNPGAGDITLAVNRSLPRSGDTAKALVINPGGPGAPGTAFTGYVARVLAPEVAAQQVIVGFDPRGTGASQPLDCLTDRQLTRWLLTDATPDTPDEQSTLMSRAGQISIGCLTRSPTMARFVGTEQTVQDMDVLRAALGQERLNYLGFSYGTYLGIRYAEEFPDLVGAMVLDGPVDPQLDAVGWSKGQADGFQLALTRFAADCAGRADCPFVGDANAVLSGLDGFLRGLDDKPLKTRSAEALVQSQALNAVFASMYTPQSWGSLRRGLSTAVRGDGTALQTIANQAADRVGPASYSTNMQEAFLGIACWDAPPTPGQATMARLATQWARDAQVPEIARAMAWGMAPCTKWYGHQPWAPAPAPTTTTAPILILGTRYDPATPYSWAVSLHGQLPTSRLITWEGDGHTAYGNGSTCVDSMVRDFLLTGQQIRSDITCS